MTAVSGQLISTHLFVAASVVVAFTVSVIYQWSHPVACLEWRLAVPSVIADQSIQRSILCKSECLTLALGVFVSTRSAFCLGSPCSARNQVLPINRCRSHLVSGSVCLRPSLNAVWRCKYAYTRAAIFFSSLLVLIVLMLIVGRI